MQTRIQFLSKQLHAFQERPVLVTPLGMYTLQKENLNNFQNRLKQAIMILLQNQQAKTNQFRASLNALSPYAVIERGYAITTRANGDVIHSLKEVKVGDMITTQLKDGSFTSEVKKKG
jgi:exodeoxyribonuclease VII large subunit